MSSAGELLFVHAGQGTGRALDHLSPGHTCDGLVPVRVADVGHVALQHLPHRHQQARPAQAVVGRGQRLGLERFRNEKTFFFFFVCSSSL